MSAKKKEKSVVQMEVEDELARAAKELEAGLPPASSSAQKPDQSDFKDLFTEMLRQQALTNSQIVKSLQDTQKSGQAVVSAVQSLQQATLVNKTPMPANPNANANPNIIQLDESPGESEGYLSSDDEDYDFEGWDIPASQPSAPTPEAPPPEPAAVPSTSAEAPIDDQLFQGYSQMPNWNPASQVLTWFASINNKEVPSQVSKDLSDTLIPKVEYQPLFAPPQLPKAIHDRLHSAPKYLSKIPKMVNEHLLKAQKELTIANKTFTDTLSFYYSDQFIAIKEIIPEISDILEGHKSILSQGMALVISASLKISKARKDAIRPIFKLPAVLRQDPTAAQVLGTDDLASLSEKTSKEQKALSSCFRPSWASRQRLKYGRAGTRSHRGFKLGRA